MKRFTLTPFFHLLKDATLTEGNVDTRIWESNYDAFAVVLFSEAEAALSNDKAAFANILSYTRCEFYGLEKSGMIEKNVGATICLQKALGLIDRQIDWMERQLLAEKNAIHCPLIITTPNWGKLKWTGSQVEFVEMVYSLRESHSINEGNISLKELFAVLTGFFDFHLTDYYRFFNDITKRGGDRTLFLDKLKKTLMLYLSKLDNRQY